MRPSLLPTALAASLAPMCLAQFPITAISNGSTGFIYPDNDYLCIGNARGEVALVNAPLRCASFTADENGCLTALIEPWEPEFGSHAVVVDPDAPHRLRYADGCASGAGWAAFGDESSLDGVVYAGLVWFTEQGGERRVAYGPSWSVVNENGAQFLQGDPVDGEAGVTLELRGS
ncbi:uncharacterized protein DSM5745_03652 [Aspergillus mulundensis]|uniref:Uncharacterized protein n=1 Tax=Aspergillus mulundensis TaxID=1810919 RepID=A0A3D8SL13_9EURO|nr:hypothetical protein DSM5745_03652 [Aspergillus mulundensis]RDW87010.1 hypothetical protein DSM5745_03652 [Aspergillus mulundensis]